MTLTEAILKENLQEVMRILTENPQLIEETGADGIPLSFVAAKTGNLAIVQYIVEYSRASMNVTDGEHRNILHFGVMSGNISLVKYLVERVGMSPVMGDIHLKTPYDLAHELHFAQIEDYFAKTVGFAYEEAYHNPIRTGFYPDPSVVRVGKDYYMVNSSFVFFPCIPISHSKDLIHWNIIGYAITKPEWAGLDELEGGRGYWAPDISCYKGRYYICATYRLNDTGTVYRKQMVVSSDKPEGPYSKPVFLDEDGIDPSIFTDDDGRRYMLLNRGARIFEISEDATKQLGPATLLYYGDNKRAPEGPHLLKKDGYYYLFEAEGGTGEGHMITVSRSRSLFGVYEPCPYNPIMRQKDGGAGLQRCGHGKPIQTPDGSWYMVYLCGRMIDGKYSILGRETALDPITFTADGWPIVNDLKGPSVIQKRPKALELPKISELRDAEEKLLDADGRLSLDWVTPRPPIRDGIRVEGDVLYLRGSRLPLSNVDARNILLRRQSHFSFTAQVKMLVPKLFEGQEAGLICYYDENTWVSFGLKKEKTALVIEVHEHIGDDDRYHGRTEIVETIDAITLRVVTKKLARTFSCQIEGEEWKEVSNLQNVYYLCDEGLKRGKRFTGAMLGFFAYEGEEKTEAGFTNFSYKPDI